MKGFAPRFVDWNTGGMSRHGQARLNPPASAVMKQCYEVHGLRRKARRSSRLEKGKLIAYRKRHDSEFRNNNGGWSFGYLIEITALSKLVIIHHKACYLKPGLFCHDLGLRTNRKLFDIVQI